MKCHRCGMDIPSDAQICPFCHTERLRNVDGEEGTLAIVSLIISIASFILYFCISNSDIATVPLVFGITFLVFAVICFIIKIFN